MPRPLRQSAPATLATCCLLAGCVLAGCDRDVTAPDPSADAQRQPERCIVYLVTADPAPQAVPGTEVPSQIVYVSETGGPCAEPPVPDAE